MMTPRTTLCLAAAFLAGILAAFGGSATATSSDVDLIAVLIGDRPFEVQCCCSLIGVATDHEVSGAIQDTMSFKAMGDGVETYIKIAARTYVYIGKAAQAEDGSLSLIGTVEKSALLIVPDPQGGFVWSAFSEHRAVGSGRLR